MISSTATTSINAKKKVAYVFCGMIYAASFALSMLGCAIDDWVMYAFFKSLFMPTISILAYMSWSGPYTKQYLLLQLAFLFAWIGDILLAFSRFHSLFFILGACFFLVQHNLYIWLNLTTKSTKANLWKTPYWGLPNIAYAGLFSLNYWAKADLIMRSECIIYSLFLGTAFYTAFYREMTNRTKYWVCVIGFAFFVVSDMLIAIDKFWFPLSLVQGSSILLTYYIAQTLICYANLPDLTPTQRTTQFDIQ